MEGCQSFARRSDRAGQSPQDADSRGALARTARCAHELAPIRGLVLARAGPRTLLHEREAGEPVTSDVVLLLLAGAAGAGDLGQAAGGGDGASVVALPAAVDGETALPNPTLSLFQAGTAG
eukprot:490860-Prymnesium_polylepis.1